MAAARSCFICALNLDSNPDGNNPQFNGSCNYKTVSVLCQVLEIPSENVASRTTLQRASFCSECMETLQEIETRFKFISEKTMVLQSKLAINCEERRQQQERFPFDPLDDLRDKAIRELKSAVRFEQLRMTILTMTKPLEARPGRGYAPSMSDQRNVKEVVNGQGQSPGPTVCEEVIMDQGQGIVQPGTGTTLPDQGQSKSVVDRSNISGPASSSSSYLADEVFDVCSGAQEKSCVLSTVQHNYGTRSSFGRGSSLLLRTEVSHTNCAQGKKMDLHNSDSLVKLITNPFPGSARGGFGHGSGVQRPVKRNSPSPESDRNSVSLTNNLDSGRNSPIVITVSDSDESDNEGTSTSTRAQSAQSSTSQLSNTNASTDSAVGFGTVSLEAPRGVLKLNLGSRAVEPMSSVSHSSGTACAASSSGSSSIFTPLPPNPGSGNKRQSFNPAPSNKRFYRSLSPYEMESILQCMAESAKNGDLEKPNVEVYYTKLIAALKIQDCGPTVIKNRINRLRMKYMELRGQPDRLLSTRRQDEDQNLLQYCPAIWGIDISNAQARMHDVLNNTI